MRFNDAIFGVLLIVFAIAEIAYTRTFPTLHGQAYGPDLFPILIGVGFLITGAVLTVRGIMLRAAAPLVEIGAWAADRRNVVNFALVVLALLFYIAASDWLGFILTAFLIMVVLLKSFGSGVVTALVVAALTTLGIHTLFARVLLVPLPWGVLQPVAW
ncbi:MAG: tripartite tricarboxylate transporter TctB family protein [Geminicoccaceae bacterium]